MGANEMLYTDNVGTSRAAPDGRNFDRLAIDVHRFAISSVERESGEFCVSIPRRRISFCWKSYSGRILSVSYILLADSRISSKRK